MGRKFGLVEILIWHFKTLGITFEFDGFLK